MLMLARKLALPIVVDKSKTEAAVFAAQEFEPDSVAATCSGIFWRSSGVLHLIVKTIFYGEILVCAVHIRILLRYTSYRLPLGSGTVPVFSGVPQITGPL